MLVEVAKMATTRAGALDAGLWLRLVALAGVVMHVEAHLGGLRFGAGEEGRGSVLARSAVVHLCLGS